MAIGQQDRRLRLADPEEGRLDDIVDVERLGLDDLDGWTALGASLATALERDGIAQVPGFLRPEAVESIGNELDRVLPYVAVYHDRRSAYATGLGDHADHPAASAKSDWLAGHVTRDMIPAHSPAHRLYVSPRFKRLIAACVGLERVFEFGDPLAGLVATVLPPGGCYGWHYDTNEYVVTLGVRQAEVGGRFEFHRDLRTPGNENLDGMAAVLRGEAGERCRWALSAPGDLRVFRGRYSLHRVTEVGGNAHRLTLVLSYAARPGLIGPLDRTRRVYGRVTEAHLVADAMTHGDGLIL